MKQQLEKEVLIVLGKHGVASTKQIHEGIMIKRTRKSVENCLNKLQLKCVVSRLKSGPENYKFSYYAIRNCDRARKLASALAGEDLNGFFRKGLRYSHYEHESLCFYVHESLIKSFPKIKVYRDFDFHNSDIPEYVLPQSLIETGEVPDMIFSYPEQNGLKWIAVEVDRTRKQIDRVKRRLSTLGKKLSIEGVLYFVPSEHFIEQYGQAFQGVSSKNLRLLEGGCQSFLAKSITISEICDLKNAPVYCSDVVLRLDDWLQLICKTELRKRDVLLQSSFGTAKEA